MAVFAGITLIGIVFGDVSAAIIAAALGALACNELRGGAKLKRFDSSGARVLGWNQLALGALIVAYGAWGLKSNLGQLSSLTTLAGATGDPSTDALIARVSRMAVYGVYGGIILVGIIVPGLTALYYFSRERIVRAFIHRTPTWVVDTLRAAG